MDYTKITSLDQSVIVEQGKPEVPLLSVLKIYCNQLDSKFRIALGTYEKIIYQAATEDLPEFYYGINEDNIGYFTINSSFDKFQQLNKADLEDGKIPQDQLPSGQSGIDNLLLVEEDGFFLVDEDLNIGGYATSEGSNIISQALIGGDL